MIREGLDGRQRDRTGAMVKFEDQEKSSDASGEPGNCDYDDKGLVEFDSSHSLVQKWSVSEGLCGAGGKTKPTPGLDRGPYLKRRSEGMEISLFLSVNSSNERHGWQSWIVASRILGQFSPMKVYP